MTDLLRDVETPSDAELISRVRGGDVAAYGELFSRHKDAATRLARQLVRGPDSDDLVSEAFAKVLTVLQGGGGPDVAFRAYLLTAVRRLHIDRVRLGQRLQTTDDMTPFDPGVPFQDTAVAGFESGAAAKAFASLPERWQLVLWHLEVEGQKPADIAPLLGMSPNSVSALAYRAREGLRQAFLTMHLSDISGTDCRWVTEHLGAFVRKGLSKRDTAKIAGHLDGCRRCTAMYLELDEVNSNLAGIIAPLLLGAAATGYLASGGAGATGAVVGMLSRAKELVAANTGAVAAGGVAAGVAAVAVTAVSLGAFGHHKPDVVADQPAGLTSASAPAAAGGSPSVTAGPSGSTGTRTATPAATAGPSTGPTPTVSASASPAPIASVSPSASLSTAPPSGPVPTTPAGASPSSSPATVAPPVPPGGSPSTPASESPTPPTTPDRVLADPVLDAGGTVTVDVQNLRSTDTLEVTITSDETTFRSSPGVSGCRFADSRRVTCRPEPVLPRRAPGAAAAAVSDYSVVLPMAFPDYMVSDDVSVTATVNGLSSSTHDGTFRPARTPAFDFRAPVLTAPVHTLSGDVDRYDVTTTAVLPPRVTGLVYTLTGPARFRPVDGDPCAVAADGRTLTCATVANDAPVGLSIEATSLTHPADVGVRVSAVDDFTESSPGDETATLTLAPAADLGLDLAVVSANPDRSARVTLAGTLTGVRDGLDRVVYSVSEGASFSSEATDNPGCTPAGAVLHCGAPVAGDVHLTVRADHPNSRTPVSVSVAPATPFVPAGAGPHSADVTLPDRPVHDFSFAGLSETAHTLVGDTDTYTLTGTVGDLPADVSSVAFALTEGGAFADEQTDGRCALSTNPVTGGEVVCTGLTSGTDLALQVDSTSHSTHEATVQIQASDPYDDLVPADDTQTVTGLRPGTHLVVHPHDLGRLHQDAAGDYPVSVTVSGIRPGVDSIGVALPDGLAIVAAGTGGCAVADAAMVCRGLADGDPVAFTATSVPAAAATTRLILTATPSGDFEDLYHDNAATASLVPSYDYAMGPELRETAHTLTGGTDTYTLAGTVSLPSGADSGTFELTEGGTLSADQAEGCTVLGASALRCTPGKGGEVSFRVDSSTVVEHAARVRVVTPDGSDDPRPGNEGAAAPGLRPGVDLHLAALDPDNESPSNADDQHLVATTLSGVRAGLGEVGYRLTGAATFSAVDVPGCTVSTRTVTCSRPADGPVTFTVTADDVRARTPITIAAEAGPPFVELAAADGSAGATLLPRPTYDFGIGALTVPTHTVTPGTRGTGYTDHYTVRGTLRALPDGVDGVTLVLTGGAFADRPGTGCARADDTHVRCTDLGRARTVDLRVDSTSSDAHRVGLTVQVPRGYDDNDPSDDAASVLVTPGVDLQLGALTPADPVPGATGTYRLSGTLTGVRSGPVTLTLSGNASFTAASCERLAPTVVTCTDPAEGRTVDVTIRPAAPATSSAVTVEAHAAPAFEELDGTDNSSTATLAPDVVLASLTQRSDHPAYAGVRARVSGVPAGVSTVRLRLSGDHAGLGQGQVHFTSGATGADGEGGVDCYTSDAGGASAANGLYATCTGVASSTGSFYVDTRLAHPHGTSTPVTFRVVALGVDEGHHDAENSRALTLR
jgi:RNA polymerase sigma factor (sigma-70 family)